MATRIILTSDILFVPIRPGAQDFRTMKEFINRYNEAKEFKPEVKKVDTNLNTEKAIELIHNQPQEKERTKRITIDLPFSFYVEIKKEIIEEEKALKGFFIELAINNYK